MKSQNRKVIDQWQKRVASNHVTLREERFLRNLKAIPLGIFGGASDTQDCLLISCLA